MLESLQLSVLKVVEENNDLKEHNGMLKRVQNLLMGRIAEAERACEEAMRHKAEIAHDYCLLQDQLQAMRRVKYDAAVNTDDLPISSGRRQSTASADDSLAIISPISSRLSASFDCAAGMSPCEPSVNTTSASMMYDLPDNATIPEYATALAAARRQLREVQSLRATGELNCLVWVHSAASTAAADGRDGSAASALQRV